MSTDQRRRLFLSAVCAATLLATEARAQDGPQATPGPPPSASPGSPAQSDTPATPSTQDAADRFPEVVVTANKRAESLQSVPVAVSAYTSAERDKIGIITVQDITNFTPGTQYQAGLDRVSIRGIGRLTNNLATEGGVAIYYDGIYTSSTREAGQPPLLIDRVEVLRGPQGTLYGRNSVGGAINVISQRPTKELKAEVRGIVGNYARTSIQAAISGPIDEHLGFRLAGYRTDQQHGWFRNVSGLPSEGGVEHNSYIEGQLKAEFGNFEGWIKYAYNDSHGRPRVDILRSPYDTAYLDPNNPASTIAPTYTVPGPYFGLITNHTQAGSVTTNPAVTDPRRFNTDTTQRSSYYSHNLTADLVYHFGGANLRYLAGYRKYRNELISDYDDSPVTSYTYPGSNLIIYPTYDFDFIENKEWYSHELNLSSEGASRFQWILGAYFYHEKYGQPLHIPAPNQAQFSDNLNIFVPGDALGNVASGTIVRSPYPNPRRDVYFVDADITNRSYAFFAQGTYAFLDQFKATLGVRHTNDKKSGEERALETCWLFPAYVCGGGPTVGPVDWTEARFIVPDNAKVGPLPDGVVDLAYRDTNTGKVTRHLSKSWAAWTGTADLDWTPDRSTLVYAKYSRGYKAGGFNAQSLQAFPTTKPEYVNAYEVGAKKTFGNLLLLDAASYYYDYTELQTPVTVIPANGGPGQVLFYNLPKSRSYGFELESVFRPVDALSFTLSYSYLNAKIQDACCFVDPTDTQAREPGAKPAANVPAPGALTGPQVGQDLKGQALPNSPRNKVTVNATYELRFDPGSLVLSGTYTWRDKTYYSVFNRDYNLAPSFDQVDLRASWTDTANRYTVIAFVRNVTDSLGRENRSASRQTANPNAPAGTYGALAIREAYVPPRTFGLELQYRF